jgi:hypothetical protein
MRIRSHRGGGAVRIRTARLASEHLPAGAGAGIAHQSITYEDRTRTVTGTGLAPLGSA